MNWLETPAIELDVTGTVPLIAMVREGSALVSSNWRLINDPRYRQLEIPLQATRENIPTGAMGVFAKAFGDNKGYGFWTNNSWGRRSDYAFFGVPEEETPTFESIFKTYAPKSIGHMGAAVSVFARVALDYIGDSDWYDRQVALATDITV